MNALISGENVSFGYRKDKPILDDISFSIAPGQLISVLGPNGVGKSTLLNCLCGLLSLRKGRITLLGNDISQLTRRQIAKSIACVSQKLSIAFDYSVREFVVMGRTAHMGVLNTPSPNDYRIVNEALERLDILPLAPRPITELSGGEVQKVCIARALVQEPQLILLDEPTSALDYGNQGRVLRLIRRLCEEGYSVLMTTHNPEHALLLESEVWMLFPNGKLLTGTAEEMITPEKLEPLYGTDLTILPKEIVGRRVCLLRSL